MSLYDDWQNLIDNQSKKSFDAFIDKYNEAEIKIYSDILKDPEKEITGIFSELVQKYDVDESLFMGFLDGVNTSQKKPLELETIETGTAVTIFVDPEKLYFNMLTAGAEHLYTLPEWDNILDMQKRDEITKEYKKSRTVVKEKGPGRNDPCTCGSGKKYKKCCGA